MEKFYQQNYWIRKQIFFFFFLKYSERTEKIKKHYYPFFFKGSAYIYCVLALCSIVLVTYIITYIWKLSKKKSAAHQSERCVSQDYSHNKNVEQWVYSNGEKWFVIKTSWWLKKKNIIICSFPKWTFSSCHLIHNPTVAHNQ